MREQAVEFRAIWAHTAGDDKVGEECGTGLLTDSLLLPFTVDEEHRCELSLTWQQSIPLADRRAAGAVLKVITQCVTQPNKPAMAVHFLWLANVILGVSFLPFRARFALQPPVVN